MLRSDGLCKLYMKNDLTPQQSDVYACLFEQLYNDDDDDSTAMERFLQMIPSNCATVLSWLRILFFLYLKESPTTSLGLFCRRRLYTKNLLVEVDIEQIIRDMCTVEREHLYCLLSSLACERSCYTPLNIIETLPYAYFEVDVLMQVPSISGAVPINN
jgi:hypothetical protein